MNRRLLLPLLFLTLPGAALADPNTAPPAAGMLCRQAIRAAERAHGIPNNLLSAIARIESGRRDQASGTFNAWPWTINMDGQGSFYETKAQAVAAATAMRPRVTKSIDVGCMQISLKHHPDAFASLEQAFDPNLNADYGARFLVQLHDKTNSWPKAVELYHSATPELGQDYQRKVYAVLPEEQKVASISPDPVSPGAVSATPWSWASGLNHSLLTAPLRQAAPRVIPLASGPDGAAAPGRSLEFYRSAPIRAVTR